MRAGRSAPEALRALLAGDGGREVRQVGMVDAGGHVATHTGTLCIPAAGGQEGGQYVVQANLMEKSSVWPAMARAFEAAKGDLAERLLAALDAAEGEGGDIRGRQSAALVVVKGKSTGRPWADRLFDLRVEDHPDPLKELRRLVQMQRAYNHMSAGDDCVAAKDWACAEHEYGTARKLEPGGPCSPRPSGPSPAGVSWSAACPGSISFRRTRSSWRRSWPFVDLGSGCGLLRSPGKPQLR
jgi:uncharacterized Ntn-hydrolase superfamily protein